MSTKIIEACANSIGHRAWVLSISDNKGANWSELLAIEAMHYIAKAIEQIKESELKMNIFERVTKFNADAGTALGQTFFSEEDAVNEIEMLEEEVYELKEALLNKAKKVKDANGTPRFVTVDTDEEARVEVADALGDIIFVAMGTMAKLGIDFERVMTEICDSNDSKYTDGRLIKNMVGKIQKGPNFKAPNLSFTKKVG